MSQEEAPRRGGMRAVSVTLPTVTKGAVAKRGFAEARLLLDWATIVGETLARHTVPDRLQRPRGEGGGVLHIRVAGAFALELQHLEPVVIERINAHFGHAAVARLRLTQGLPASIAKPRRRRRPLGAAAEAELASSVERIGDPRLKEALTRLGRAILTEEPKT
jgi:hypothetical protein